MLSVQTVGGSDGHLSHLSGVLEPMRLTLQTQPYLGGSSPSYADFAVAGAFAVCMSVLHSCSTPCYSCNDIASVIKTESHLSVVYQTSSAELTFDADRSAAVKGDIALPTQACATLFCT